VLCSRIVAAVLPEDVERCEVSQEFLSSTLSASNIYKKLLLDTIDRATVSPLKGYRFTVIGVPLHRGRGYRFTVDKFFHPEESEDEKGYRFTVVRQANRLAD
jgi:hypothetical protein